MATDIRINSELQTEWNENGDFETVTDGDQLEQTFIISIVENVDLRTSLVESDIEAQRTAIREAIKNNPQSEQPIEVFASVVDDDGDFIIKYSIFTQGTEFTFSTDQQ